MPATTNKKTIRLHTRYVILLVPVAILCTAFLLLYRPVKETVTEDVSTQARTPAQPEGVLSPGTTSTWMPTSSTQLAMIGFVDFDKDGENDQSEIEAMIETSGCRLVAKQDSKGKVSGEITPNVSYLIVNNTSDPNLIENPLYVSAQRNGVIPIEATSFVGFYGKHFGDRRGF